MPLRYAQNQYNNKTNEHNILTDIASLNLRIKIDESVISTATLWKKRDVKN